MSLSGGLDRDGGPGRGGVPDHDVALLEEEAAGEPLEQFRRWYGEAAGVVRLPEAAAVATADEEGAPSARMVLVKEVDERGFTFFTSSASRKGRELLARPAAALLFYWDPLGRQVRVEGPVHAVEPGESDAYFATRPRGSQLSAHASRQSSPIGGRAALEAAVAEVAARFGDGLVPRPEGWGGFRLEPRRFEFWQSRDDRLHDRLAYERRPAPTGREPGRWTRVRLQP